MNEKIIVEYLEEKLSVIDSLKNKDTSDAEFKAWESSVRYIMGRLGKDYEERMDSICYTPMAFVMGADNSEIFRDSYNSGLESARAVISSTIDEIRLLGMPSSGRRDDFSNGINISVNQSLLLNNFDVGDYDCEIRAKVEELYEELKKENRNRSKIKRIVQWLLDKGMDALIAVLANSFSK